MKKYFMLFQWSFSGGILFGSCENRDIDDPPHFPVFTVSSSIEPFSSNDSSGVNIYRDPTITLKAALYK